MNFRGDKPNVLKVGYLYQVSDVTRIPFIDWVTKDIPQAFQSMWSSDLKLVKMFYQYRVTVCDEQAEDVTNVTKDGKNDYYVIRRAIGRHKKALEESLGLRKKIEPKTTEVFVRLGFGTGFSSVLGELKNKTFITTEQRRYPGYDVYEKNAGSTEIVGEYDKVLKQLKKLSDKMNTYKVITK